MKYKNKTKFIQKFIFVPVLLLFLVLGSSIFVLNKTSQVKQYKQVKNTNAPSVPTYSIQPTKIIQPTPTSIPVVTLLELSFVGVDTLYIGDTVDLQALATYSNGKKEAVDATWSVEGDYLKLTKNSLTSVQIEPQRDGLTNVAAEFAGKKAAKSFRIINPDHVEILYWGSDAPYGYSIQGHGEYYLKLTYKDSYSYPLASWSSDNDCATFETTANFRVKVTFVKTGSCRINAAYMNLGASKTLPVAPEGQAP